MPNQVPTWIDKVNYIVDFWVDPCHAPVIVYIQLARDPLAHALLSWFSFGLDDVLRGYLRPSKALGGSSFSRRGKEKKRGTRFRKARAAVGGVIKHVPGIGDDIGNWIGKNLPGAQEVKGRSIGQGERLLWMIDDLGQRALLALLIADIAIDFLYEWATLVADTEFCKRDKRNSLYATGPAPNTGFPITCWPLNEATVVFAEGDVSWIGNVGHCGTGIHRAVSGVSFVNSGGTPVNHYQRFQIQDVDGVRILASAPQVIAPGGSGESVGQITINGPGSFEVVHCAEGGSVAGITHDLAIWGGVFL